MTFGWAPNEPSDHHDILCHMNMAQECVLLYMSDGYLLDDEECDLKRLFICESKGQFC